MGNFKLSFISFFVLTALTLGCKRFEASPYIAEEFYSYVSYFEDLTGSKVNVSLNFGSIGEHYLGICKVNRQNREILINEAWFKSTTEQDKLVLILHELGHCMLNKHHNNLILNDKCPASIMNTYHIGRYCFLLHKDYYLKEYLNEF